MSISEVGNAKLKAYFSNSFLFSQISDNGTKFYISIIAISFLVLPVICLYIRWEKGAEREKEGWVKQRIYGDGLGKKET